MPLISIDGGSTQFNTGDSSSVVVTLSGSPPQGSFVFVQIASTGGTNQTFTPPGSGWVLIARQNNGTNPANGCFYKIAGPSEPSTYTFTLGSSNATACCYLVFHGVDQNDPISGVAGANGSTDSVITFGAVTTSSTYGKLIKTVAARNTSSPPDLLDPGTNSSNIIMEGNVTPTCMMSCIMTDVDITGAGTYTGSDATMDLVCTKATISFVINEAVSPPLAWINV